jgi:hypothetical protein
MVAQLTTFAREVTRVALEVGTYGQLGGQAVVEGVEGTWADLTTNVNVRRPPSCLLRLTKLSLTIFCAHQLQKMAANLTNQVREIAHVVRRQADRLGRG